MSVTVFVEGGGEKNKALAAECRRGFSEFFRRAGLDGRMPKVVACGARSQAFQDFRTALRTTGPDVSVLLVDSEAPVNASNAWDHVRSVDNWQRPQPASDDQLHLMVQCMESWFLADLSVLEEFFGQGFHPNSISPRPNLEDVPKQAVLAGLKAATSHCQKGPYEKGNHAFKILAKIDPGKVEQSSPNAHRLLERLRQVLL